MVRRCSDHRAGRAACRDLRKERSAPSLCRQTGHPQLRRIRRRSGCSSTTWTTATVRQADPDLRRSRRARSQRTSRASPRTLRPAGCSSRHIKRVGGVRSHDGTDSGMREYEGGADRHRPLARRQDPLRAVVRGTALARGRRGDRRRAREDRAPTPARTTRIYGPDGRHVYLAGLKIAKLLDRRHADPQGRRGSVGPFSASVRPFTVNGAQTLCFVNVNDLLGFEIGDMKTGKMLHRVEVTGFEKGPVKRHGCPSHGIGLTPDEKETLARRRRQQQGPRLRRDGDAAETGRQDQAARAARLGDVQPRRQVRLPLDRRSDRRGDEEDRRDAHGRSRSRVHSEKMVEVVLSNGKPITTGDQFGIGRRP